MSKAFPDRISSIADELARYAGPMTLIREYNGRSGAFVGQVDCRGGGESAIRSGRYIIKVGTRQSGRGDERERHALALSDVAFNGKVANLLASCEADTQYAMLVEIAGGNPYAWHPVSASGGQCGQLSSAYVGVINALWEPMKMRLSDESCTPAQLIKAWLSHRISETGRIQANARMLVDHDPTQFQQFMYLQRVYPNPVSFVLREDEWRTSDLLIPLEGPCHGDLHVDNVFACGLTPSGHITDVRFIDLATYKPSAPFFHDQAYFELALLVNSLTACGTKHWVELTRAAMAYVTHRLANGLEPASFTAMHADIDVPASVLGWLSILKSGVDQARTLLEDRARNFDETRRAELAKQFLLARVSAGLAYVNKSAWLEGFSVESVPGPHWQAFLWACVALDEYQRLTRADPPLTGRSIPNLWLARDTDSLAVQNAEDAWRELGGVDESGINLLFILPGSTPTTELLRLPWNCVVDLRTTRDSLECMKALALPVRMQLPHDGIRSLDAMRGGILWYFANGREDISSSPPRSSIDWLSDSLYRHRLHELLDLLVTQPAQVRCIVLADDGNPQVLNAVCGDLSPRVAKMRTPILVVTKAEGSAKSVLALLPATFKATTEATLSELVRQVGHPRPLARDPAMVLVPRALDTGETVLAPLPPSTHGAVSKDLVVVHAGLADSPPAGRELGVDFFRGARIEWAELAQNLDLPRDIYDKLHRSIRDRLTKRSNSIMHFSHAPSAGGTTLARRLAWDLKETFPVVELRRGTQTTAESIAEVYKHSSLPVLVVIERDVLFDSDVQRLANDLHTRGAGYVLFVVTRHFNDNAPSSRSLESRLSDEEARLFYDTYRTHVHDPARLGRLDLLRRVNSPERAPFFFGLTAFAEGYLGLEPLVDDVLNGLDDNAAGLVTDLALLAIFGGRGYPREAFDELREHLLGGRWPFAEHTPFALVSNSHVRVPHALIAERVLARIGGRGKAEWDVSLYRFATTLLNHLDLLRSRDSEVIVDLVRSVFVERDTETVIKEDLIVHTRRPFAPIIERIDASEDSRDLLKRITRTWDREPHFAVHYIRHLLYREPSAWDDALLECEMLARLPEMDVDYILPHTIGMVHRSKMLDRLKTGATSFVLIADTLKHDFDQAIRYFDRATALAGPDNEYGRVSALKAITWLFQYGRELAKCSTLTAFLFQPEHTWCLDAYMLGESYVNELRRLSGTEDKQVARQGIADWVRVTSPSNDDLIARVRTLRARGDSAHLRRMQYLAMQANRNQAWAHLEQATIEEIADLAKRNTQNIGVKSIDYWAYLMAVRRSAAYRLEDLVRIASEWATRFPESDHAAYYRYVTLFLRWINLRSSTGAKQSAVARECLDATGSCAARHDRRSDQWGPEFLGRRSKSYVLVDSADFGYSPAKVFLQKEHSDADRARFSELQLMLPREYGTIVEYTTRSAKLDLGDGIRISFGHRQIISRDDVGRRGGVFISFQMNGPRGWDFELEDATKPAPQRLGTS